MSFRAYARNLLQQVHLAGDSSMLRTSEWRTFCEKFFITLRSIQNDTLVIPRVCEESHVSVALGGIPPSYGRRNDKGGWDGLTFVISSKAVRPTRNLRANESKKKNRFSFCRVPQKISLVESRVILLEILPPYGRQNDYNVIPNEYEESPAFYRLRFFDAPRLKMTTAKSCNILREILQGKAFQNDIIVISNESERSYTRFSFS